MSQSNGKYTATCLNGGCDFDESGAADKVNKAAEAHVHDTGHATITSHAPGGPSLSEQVDAVEREKAVQTLDTAEPNPEDPAVQPAPAKKAAAKKTAAAK